MPLVGNSDFHNAAIHRLGTPRTVALCDQDVRGMDITFTTTATTDEEGRALLKAFNFPFRNNFV